MGCFQISPCRINISIAVPEKTSLDLRGGSNNVRIYKTKGNIDLRLGSGNAEIEADTKKINVRLGSGSLKARGIFKEAQIKIGSGSVEFSYTSLPKKGKLDVKSGSGNVVISLPKQAQVQTHFSSGSGVIKSTFASHFNAKFLVSLKTGSGNVSLKEAA